MRRDAVVARQRVDSSPGDFLQLGFEFANGAAFDDGEREVGAVDGGGEGRERCGEEDVEEELHGRW